MESIKILLLDCQKMFVEGLKSYIAMNSLPYDIVNSCCSFEESMKLIKNVDIDILVFELNIPDKNGIEILNELDSKDYNFKKLVLTSYSDPKFVRSAMMKGADAFVSKRSEMRELFEAFEEILDGGVYIGQGLSITPAAYDIKKNNVERARNIQDAFTLRNKLTARETEILELIIDKKNNRQIGKELYISHQTVGVHRKNIIKKLGLNSTEGLIKFATENQLVRAY